MQLLSTPIRHGMQGDTFGEWRPEYTDGWNRRPLSLPHHWHRHPLFGLDALAALIDAYPPDEYLLAQAGSADSNRRWREGDLGRVPGRDVIRLIGEGRMWLNLRNVHQRDRRYADLLDAAYAEMSRHVPGFEPSAMKMGILISSPNAKVNYHADLPGQALWQIAGRKRVHVYPAQPPYLTPEALENIALTGVEFILGYQPGFEAGASTMELAPGQMLTWPLNSPHRVDNHDCLNISVTTEHWTPENRRSQKVHLANAVLRQRLHYAPRSRSVHGPQFWTKSLLQAAWRRSPWAARSQRLQRPIDFRLAPDAPGGVVDIATVYR